MNLFNDDRGVSLIELSLLLPTLVLLLFGAAEYGRLCYMGIEVTNAAHAAVQYGSQNHASASDNAGMLAAATNEGTDLAKVDSSWKTSGVATQHLCASTYSDTPTTCTGVPSIEYVQANTVVNVVSLFAGYGFPRTYALHGQAIERVRE